METAHWIYSYNQGKVILPGQKVYTEKFPISSPLQTYFFYAGVFTTGIGDIVDWRVDITLYWKCHRIVHMA